MNRSLHNIHVFRNGVVVLRNHHHLSSCSRRSYTTSASSINPDEVKFFSRLSSQWWDERGEFAMLHRMNPARMSFIRDKLSQCFDEEATAAGLDASPRTVGKQLLLEGMEVLDIGSGGGLLSESLARLGAKTTGIDANLRYIHGTAESIVAEALEYDAVFSMEVLEHVENPYDFLVNCVKLVKPGGHLFLSTISRTPLSYFLTIFMAEQALGLVHSGTHNYSKFVKSSELVEFFSRPEIAKEAEVRQIHYNPLVGTWTIEPLASLPTIRGAFECNYLFWARKPA
ncbi:S-adenosyl-L-methionine-dependent methyltransferase [Cantharellus anzutake]|uniref:S-adenosyl-L-methionine-dependent methyltransferase n=1 Tax=Cantharellus anzutake TaxID=1750568 RepID=UPI00190787A9|nr:S-adenosyl-L-methionine-dependent methyltransferase [Cantharellus anzutake]KAF8328394.1 S-adenosyl-L-methionine-dependent methyltransferase [Cantharellus anzutake]